VERARGHLYAFHQLIGGANPLLGDAVEELREAGHYEQADRLSDELIGRNILAGRWTFQIMEEFDDGYWTAFRPAPQLHGLTTYYHLAEEPPSDSRMLHLDGKHRGPLLNTAIISNVAPSYSAGAALIASTVLGAHTDAETGEADVSRRD